MKQYEITNLEQILNVVNDSNIEHLINDFAKWLIFYHEAIKSCREQNPKETEGKSNFEILQCAFLWTDDGKSELTGCIMTNSKTGEVTRTEFTK